MPKKAKSSGTAENKKIQLAGHVVARPICVLHEGQWVAIGGPVNRVGKPPKISVIVPEATEEQYEKLAVRFPHLITLL